MKKKILFGLLILAVLLINGQQGCQVQQQTQQQTGISQVQAERIAIGYVEGEGATGSVLNSYKEGNRWRVQVSARGEGTGWVEINVQTGEIECLVDSGGDRDCK